MVTRNVVSTISDIIFDLIDTAVATGSAAAAAAALNLMKTTAQASNWAELAVAVAAAVTAMRMISSVPATHTLIPDMSSEPTLLPEKIWNFSHRNMVTTDM